MTDVAADGPAMAAAFEDLLREIDRLRSVSDRIETPADEHPGMEQGLVSVAGNIRNIATVLDVFTLIRSKVGGSQGAPNLQTTVYMNWISPLLDPERLWVSNTSTAKSLKKIRNHCPHPPTTRVTVIGTCYLEQCTVEHDDSPNNARFGPPSFCL